MRNRSDEIESDEMGSAVLDWKDIYVPKKDIKQKRMKFFIELISYQNGTLNQMKLIDKYKQ